jgi:ATP-dependent Clp protease protease subunit
MKKALWIFILLLTNSCVTMGGGGGPPPATLAAIRFSGAITSSSVAPIIAALQSLDQMAPEKRPSAIVFEINSPGGEVDAGFDLTKAIERSPVPVLCIVDGEADSMAFYVLQSCTARFMTPRSSLMFHGVTMVGPMRQTSMETTAKQIEVYNSAMIGQVAARMKISKDALWAHLKQGDWWMDADEALEVGAVDAIIPVAEIP